MKKKTEIMKLERHAINLLKAWLSKREDPTIVDRVPLKLKKNIIILTYNNETQLSS